MRARPESPLKLLVPIFADQSEETSYYDMFMDGTLPRFDCSHTLAALVGTPIACPDLELPLLNTYFAYLVRKELMRAPSG